jgi:lysophospholipase L1-like esterase
MTSLNRRAMLALAASAGAVAAPVPARAQSPEERLHTDWAYLSRYRNENDALVASGARIGAVFMGDSITEGWVQKAPAFFTAGRLGRGISGQTTPQMLVRFRQDVIRLEPRIVHVMAGTNDIAGNTGPMSAAMTLDNLKSMTEIAQANGVRVIIASIPPAAGFHWRPGLETAEPIMALNRWLHEYAASAGAVYADYHAAMSDGRGGMREGLAYDGVHPSEAGYAAMAPVAERALAAAASLRQRSARRAR